MLNLFRKVCGCVGVMCICLNLSAVVPVVEEVTLKQDSVSRLVTVQYSLTDAPGIVTIEVLTNGVSIGGVNYANVEGDVNKVIATGAGHTITWHPDKSWPDHIIKTPQLDVRLTAWATNAPPTYMVANLLTGALNYYAEEGTVPNGVTNDLYKTKQMIFKRVDAAGKTYAQGGRPYYYGFSDLTGKRGWYNSSWTIPIMVPVMFSQDFYLGVYEVTQQQWYYICGNKPSKLTHADAWATRPVEQVTFNNIRGTTDAYSTAVTANSFLGKLRSKTGNIWAFDLPTEAQWEYVFRAGTVTQFYDGTYLTTNNIICNAVCNNLGRYSGNGGLNNGYIYDSATIGSAKVGSYPANPWGFYDMCGNVWEWCVDWVATDCYFPAPTNNGYALDPKGATTGSYKPLRGGSYGSASYWCDSSTRHAGAANWTHWTVGFRVAITLN